MKPTLVESTIKSLLSAHQPCMIWGPPGVGKSGLVAKVARDTKREMLDLRLPLMDSVDLRGIPSNKNGRTVWLPPDELPRNGRGIVFLDEIVQAAPIVQSAASSLILDRRIGSYVLPEGWDLIAAGNRESDRVLAASGCPATLPTASRTCSMMCTWQIG